MTESAGGYSDRLPRSDETDPEGADFATEHRDLTHAWELENGPEGAPDETVPHGLAGQDPTDTEH